MRPGKFSLDLSGRYTLGVAGVHMLTLPPMGAQWVLLSPCLLLPNTCPWISPTCNFLVWEAPLQARWPLPTSSLVSMPDSLAQRSANFSGVGQRVNVLGFGGISVPRTHLRHCSVKAASGDT